METRKRKALEDITNAYNLIPTSTLRKLVASSSNSNSISKLPPISILGSNSSPMSQKLCSGTRSDVSIGSSNINAVRSSRTVQFQTPQRGTTSGGFGSKDAVYHHWQTAAKSSNEGTDDVVIASLKAGETGKRFGKCSSSFLERPIDERKGALKPSGSSTKKSKGIRKKILDSSSSFLEKTMEKERTLRPLDTSSEKSREKSKHVLHLYNLDETPIHKISSANCLPPGSNSKNLLEKTSPKGKENVFHCPVEKVKEFGKGLLNPSSCSFEKTEKRKLVLDLAGCSSPKEKETGKRGGSYSSSLRKKPIDEKKDILEPSGSSIRRSKETGKKVLISWSSSVEKTKEKALHTFDSTNQKTSEKGKAILHPFHLDETGKHCGSSANQLPPRSQTAKRKHDSETSSCPPMLRTKAIKNEFNEAGNSKSSKSCTDPRPKFTKKRCQRTKGLSKAQEDEIEHLNKYFEELNDFELPEEFASEDDLE